MEQGIGIGAAGGAFDGELGVAQRLGNPMGQLDVVFD
jgi:hypothetical protein